MTTGLLEGKVVVQFPRLSGITEDVVDNTFWFAMDDTVDYGSTEYTAITDRLITFYNTNPGSPATQAICWGMGSVLSRVSNAAKMYVYAHDTISPADPFGTPVFSRSWTLGAAAGTGGLAAETAVCLSYHADLTDIPETETNPSPPPAVIRPASHRRGRLFIGPLNTSAAGTNTAGELVPGTIMLNALCGAASDLLAANDSDWQWVVASPTVGLDFPVVGGYVDDAFDTQRRRGKAPSTRQTWT